MTVPQCTVLVVEDNPDDAFALQLSLGKARSAQFTIIEAETLAEAIESLSTAGIDVILLDLSLPDCQGPQTVERTAQAAPSIPIVVLTGLDDERVGVDAVQAGAQDYLVKGSFDTASLERVIRYSIERHKTLRQQTAAAARWASLAEENARLVEAVEASNTLKTRFVATMSHELRSTLSAIINLTEILNDSQTERSKARHKEVVRLVRQTALESLQVLDATIELSRLESDRSATGNRPVALVEIFNQLAKEMPAKQNAIDLSWKIASDVPVLRVDPVKLKMIMRNLLSNAVKFTGHGNIAVTAKRAGATVELAVCDSGKGIPPHHVPLLFEPFVQLSGGSHGSGGLGLYVVQRLVQLLGGTIRVESVVGSGSTFTVCLPVEPEAPSSAA
jgi:signal transduction histidine kinase